MAADQGHHQVGKGPQAGFDRIHGWSGPGEDRLEQQVHDGEKGKTAGHGMEEKTVQPGLGPHQYIALGAVAVGQLVRCAPQQHIGGVDQMGARWLRGPFPDVLQVPDNLVDPFTGAGRHRQHRGVQRSAELVDIECQAVAVQHIDQIRQYRDRLAVALTVPDHLQGEVEAFFQPGGVDEAQHMLHLGVLQRPVKMLYGDPLFRGNGLQRIGAGKIHQKRIRQRTHFTGADIHRDSGEIGHFVVQAGQAVEQQALARVGAADQDDFRHWE